MLLYRHVFTKSSISRNASFFLRFSWLLFHLGFTFVNFCFSFSVACGYFCHVSLLQSSITEFVLAVGTRILFSIGRTTPSATQWQHQKTFFYRRPEPLALIPFSHKTFKFLYEWLRCNGQTISTLFFIPRALLTRFST